MFPFPPPPPLPELVDSREKKHADAGVNPCRDAQAPAAVDQGVAGAFHTQTSDCALAAPAPPYSNEHGKAHRRREEGRQQPGDVRGADIDAEARQEAGGLRQAERAHSLREQQRDQPAGRAEEPSSRRLVTLHVQPRSSMLSWMPSPPGKLTCTV